MGVRPLPVSSHQGRTRTEMFAVAWTAGLWNVDAGRDDSHSAASAHPVALVPMCAAEEKEEERESI
jgi:hypothetical protein